ncbi:hypothetical protein HHI36_022362 [Cryptolaemus montrouzieri]|uniref:Uncharacterized protein n=1 Tax=Cryptolaemus montrouzieri TaxID=559131 RepID=A0ABD2N000_9CUCU
MNNAPITNASYFDVKAWKWYRRVGTIRGSKALKGRGVGENEIKQDHFACICACLMLIEVPIDKWDTVKVDFCLDQGKISIIMRTICVLQKKELSKTS